MKKVYANSKKGFTFIEVALVLALAGLIFLMVFLALPALQRTQRDAERREEISRITQTVKNYQENNRGTLPGSGVSGSSSLVNAWKRFYNDYVGDMEDPDGGGYFDNLNVIQCESSNVADAECKNNEISTLRDKNYNADDHEMIIVQQATCKGVDPVMTSNPRKVAFLYTLEVVGMVCYNT